MFTIVEIETGKVLFAKDDHEVLEGQIAVEKVCTIEGEMQKYFNFETQEFYTL